MNDKTKENKSKQLTETLSQIEKQFGKGTVRRWVRGNLLIFLQCLLVLWD